jgi:hypothetical protein
VGAVDKNVDTLATIAFRVRHSPDRRQEQPLIAVDREDIDPRALAKCPNAGL